MDCYQIWCNLKDSRKDIEFCEHTQRYLGALQEQGLIATYRITRRKLGFGPPEIGEFNITIETNDLAQLDQAFKQVAQRTGQTELLHQCVYDAVKDVVFALYRDFPGEERKV